jgi:hypothetical protein
MDGETIRLIVVACGAIAAGLAGALIAGAFSSQNTQATISAAREAAEAQRANEREMEQARWVRDKKLEVYTQLLDRTHEVSDALFRVHWGRGSVPNVIELVEGLKLHSLALVAPLEIVDCYRKVHAAIQTMMVVVTRDDKDDEAYTSARGKFDREATNLAVLMADDVGIEVSA